jgi:UDP-N-acetylglucosamine--N-acetylmuramyl-(pentapeptide) pyrophosphoryl-undecaprenol N-acetylglucosamine transferase
MNLAAHDLRPEGATRHQPRKLRVCLAASGGGHLHEMLDLRAFWEEHDRFFVTEPTPIAHSFAKSERVHLVPAIAFGHFRVRPILSVLRTAWQNIRESWHAVRKERPDVVVSTGAGSVFFAVLFAKLLGAKYIHVEAFCRFETPTIFGRLAHRFADVRFVQSKQLANVWPNVEVFDPFVLLPPSTDAKEDLGVVIVGTVLPFDRLVNGVVSLRPENGRPSRIVAQVGEGGVRPPGVDAKEMIDFDELTALLKRANVVFCHAGNGSLMAALQAGCRIVAMPRRADLGEHWDDHQREILRAFAARGLIEVAEDADDLQPALERALAKPPQRARNDHSALIKRLRSVTHDWFCSLNYELSA